MLFGVCVSAQNTDDIVLSVEINSPTMRVNGKALPIDDEGTTPVIRKDRTCMPIRAVVEAFGGAVDWNGNTQTVTLTMQNDVIKLTINSKTAYLNGAEHTLDAEPIIENGRTLMPLRFIAEGFNLGVAWEPAKRRVTVIRDSFTDAEYNYLMSALTPYSGKAYTEINNNIPLFKDYEIIGGSFEYYSTLDELGRCDVTMASVAEDLMPTEKRGNISSVKPTGWHNEKYDFVSGGYVYNRCHLIGYQLTGENANKRNLITGTRYMNTDGMLPFENMVDDYIERTGNHVMYRVTPVFNGNNLLADGVLMEAYSVEDNGRGLSFCVYCYNVQSGVYIDYATGFNRAA